MKFRRLSAAALALSMLSATTAVVANAATSAVDFTVDEDGNYIAEGLKFEVLENGTLSVRGLADESFTKVNIPDSIDGKNVTEISGWAFYDCTNLESVEIPNSVISIGKYAFYGCESLTSITIPDSVIEIDEMAFWTCTNLTSVTISNSLTEIGSSIFGRCTSLTSVIIPDSVTTIGYGAFSRCTNLTSVIIPDSVTTIGYAAFSDCTSLTSITIPDSVTSIGELAFYGCESVTYKQDEYSGDDIYYIINFNDPYDENGLYIIDNEIIDCRDNIEQVVIPSGVTVIPTNPFSNCANLKSITIPVSVTEMKDCPFSGCTSLAEIYYEGTEEQWNKIKYNLVGYGISGTLDDVLPPGLGPLGGLTVQEYFFGNATMHYNSTAAETPDDSNSSDSEDSKTEEFKSGDVMATADEGAVPEGAEFSAELKSDESGEYSYELKFTDKDGKEVQPDGSVTVKLPLPEALKGKTVYVYRVEGEKYTDMKAKVEGDFVVFTTTHFSEYLLTAEEKGETTPDTGFAGISLTFGLITLAGAAVVVSRKRK